MSGRGTAVCQGWVLPTADDISRANISAMHFAQDENRAAAKEHDGSEQQILAEIKANMKSLYLRDPLFLTFYVWLSFNTSRFESKCISLSFSNSALLSLYHSGVCRL